MGSYDTNRRTNTDNKLTVGWGNVSQDPGFGGAADNTSVKAKIVNLIASVRTLMRSTYCFLDIYYRLEKRGEHSGAKEQASRDGCIVT